MRLAKSKTTGSCRHWAPAANVLTPSQGFPRSRARRCLQRACLAAEHWEKATISGGTDGRAVACSSDAADPGTKLASIPKTSWLDADSVKTSPVGDAVAGEPAWVQLVIYLLHAKASDDATWGGYLDSFATSGCGPISVWSPADLEALAGTQVYDAAVQYRRFFEDKHADLVARVLPQLPAAVQEGFTEESFVLAAAAVRAALIPPFDMKQPCLVPGVAAIRHSRSPNAALRMGSKRSGLLSSEPTLDVVLTAAVAAGEPLTVDFAPDTLESQVALNHGVYDMSRPALGYQLTVGLSEGSTFYDDKLDILEQQSLPPSKTFSVGPSGELPEEMLAYCRLMDLQAADAFLLESIFRNEAWDHLLQPVSEDCEQRICTGLLEGCASAAAKYPAGLAKTLAALDALGSEDPPSRQRAALLIRKAEQVVLEALQEWLERRVLNLKSLEYYQERRLKRLGLMDDDGNSTFEDMIKINM